MPNLNGKAVSIEELANRVRCEFNDHCEEMARENGLVDSYGVNICNPYWIIDIYVDSLVCAEGGSSEYYRVAYAVNGDEITFAPKDQWEKVEKEWIKVNYPEADANMEAKTLVSYGSEVKALGDGKVGGYLVLFGEPDTADFVDDFFRKSTDFALDMKSTPEGVIRYHHKLDPVIGDRSLGKAKLGVDEVGVWIEGQLDLKNKYDVAVYNLVQKRKLGWSSAAKDDVVRQVEGKAYFIKRWPLNLDDLTLTPTPADYRQVADIKSLPLEPVALKSLINSSEGNGNQPEAQPTETGQPVLGAEVTPETEATAVKSTHDIQVLESETMTDAQQTPVDAARFDTLETSVKGLSTVLDSIVSKLDAMPVSQNPGYVTADGGAADPNIKSFGDFLVAVKRGDAKRLSTVYGVKALGDGALSEDQGATGGYLIPQEYIPRLLSVVNQTSGIVPLVNVVNVNSSSGRIPSLDQFFAPTAGVGNSAFAGGVKATLTAEGGTFTETEPSFEMVEYNINKVGGVIYVTTEMMQDSPISIESLLTQYVGVAIANKEEYFIFRGNGVGQPLGILNSDAAVSTGPDTNDLFAYADAAEILSRFKSVGGNPTWVAHPSTIPDLMRFEVGTGGAVWVANVQGQVPMSLLGYPVRFSEHLPQANNAGHVGLYDLSAYTLFRKGGMSIAYSEHAAFTSGKVAWRFEERLDGKPNLKKAITLADPQGSYTVSPFSLFTD